MYATNRCKKRKRTQNWTYDEKKYLLELCKKDVNIIENKRLDADLTTRKNRAWKMVHQEFSKLFGNERNCNRLKEQWRRMKACTRSEVHEYTNRSTKYGPEIADKKRPNAFTFEIWNFMQNAKESRKTDDTEENKHSNENNTKFGTDQSNENVEVTTIISDDDESINWQQSTQSLCEVEIRDVSSTDEDVKATNHVIRNGLLSRKRTWSKGNDNHKPTAIQMHNNDLLPLSQSASMNGIGASLVTMDMLKGDELNAKNDLKNEFKLLIEMQSSEHKLRMGILRVQLETAKFNRDAAEINKIFLLNKLNSE